MTRAVPATFLLIASISALGVIATATTPKSAMTDPRYQKYDDAFQKYTKEYFGNEADWTLFKAQAIIESNLRPEVESSEHAVGVMQLKRATYAEVQGQLLKERKQRLGDIKDPASNIAAGIWYDHEQWLYWRKKSDSDYHGHFMLGSYNAGRGHVIDAQKYAEAKKMKQTGQWPTIEKVAAETPKWGRYSAETVAYVKGVFINVQGLDKKGRVVGETVSKWQDVGGKFVFVGKTLGSQVNGWVRKFPRVVPWFGHHLPWKHDR
jgi:soluble lytic murein transglycosylase-like protein